MERALCENPQYDYARRLGQLAPLTVHRVTQPLEKYHAHELRRGRRLGDIKPPLLATPADADSPDWEHVFS